MLDSDHINQARTRTQKFLQRREQVKITWGQAWTTCWMLENFPPKILKRRLRSGSSMRGRKRSLLSGRRLYIVLPGSIPFSVDTVLRYDKLTSRSVREALSWTPDALSLKHLCPSCLCPRGHGVATLQSHSICHHDDISPSLLPATQLLTHCFMTSTINDVPTFEKCWSHSVSLLSQLARNSHLAQHWGVLKQCVKVSLHSACPYNITIILLVLIYLLQIMWAG